MYVVAVTFQIYAEKLNVFLPMMLENAAASVANEPACHQFDVCENPDNPTEIFLYEVYDDRAAFDAHLQSPHFIGFNHATKDMIAEKVVRTFHRIAG